MTPLLFLVAMASSVPSVNYQDGCRSEQRTDGQSGVYEQCVQDEKAALATLSQRWASYPASVRGDCTGLGALGNSYVELLTCIEIKTGLTASSEPTNGPLPPVRLAPHMQPRP